MLHSSLSLHIWNTNTNIMVSKVTQRAVKANLGYITIIFQSIHSRSPLVFVLLVVVFGSGISSVVLRLYREGKQALLTSKNDLFIIHVNIRSLQKNIEDLLHLITEFEIPPDAICVTETGLKFSPSLKIGLPNYNFIDEKHQNKGWWRRNLCQR